MKFTRIENSKKLDRIILYLMTLVLFASTLSAQDSLKETPATANRWNPSIGTKLPTDLASHFKTPSKWKNQYGTYRSPLIKEDGTFVSTNQEWQIQRTKIKDWWMQKLGTWPPIITKPTLNILKTVDRCNHFEHEVSFLWTPTESTVGYLLIPKSDEKKAAVVTVFYEPETAIGQGKPNRDFAIQLTNRGFITLSIGTTEATAAQTYGIYHPSINNATVAPLSMLAYAAANAWHVLASLEEVDPNRIGIVGHSFGGKWAMFASCLFENYACAAWSDPGIVFDESRPSVNYWEPWYLGYHPPPWRKRGLITPQNPANGVYNELRSGNHDLHLLHALMAPRPFLVSGGSEDPPNRWEALNHTIQINDLLGFQNRVGMTNRPLHDPNPESNEVIYRFFEHFLADQ